MRRVFEGLGIEFRAEIGLVQALARLVTGHDDHVVQLQDAAFAGLEGLAVGPVHRAEADML